MKYNLFVFQKDSYEITFSHYPWGENNSNVSPLALHMSSGGEKNSPRSGRAALPIISHSRACGKKLDYKPYCTDNYGVVVRFQGQRFRHDSHENMRYKLLAEKKKVKKLTKISICWIKS